MADEDEFHKTPVVQATDQPVAEPVGINDVGTIPKGTIDPVYEAKARVLNRAVGPHATTYCYVEAHNPCRYRTLAWDG